MCTYHIWQKVHFYKKNKMLQNVFPLKNMLYLNDKSITHTPQPTWHYSTLSIFLVCCFWPINPLGTSLGYFPFSRFASHPFALVRWYSRMQTRNKKDSQPPLVSFAKSFLYSIKLTLTQIFSIWIHYFTLLKKLEVNSIELPIQSYLQLKMSRKICT